jgi:hypothetical protein
MYKYITNPNTGRKVSIYGKLGKQILNNYLKIQTGSSNEGLQYFITLSNNKRKEQVTNAKKYCDSNIWDSGLEWNEHNKSCTKGFQTKLCKNNNISKRKCNNYILEQKKEQ